MSELKPCPFCGGEAWMRISDAPQILRIECRRCHVATTSFVADSIGEKEAAAAWNTRHVETCRLPETYIDHGSIEYNGTTSWRLCSACGAEVLADPANYCPNCGRKVEG